MTEPLTISEIEAIEARCQRYYGIEKDVDDDIEFAEKALVDLPRLCTELKRRMVAEQAVKGDADTELNTQTSEIESHQSLRGKILEEARKGNVVLATFDGLFGVAPLDEFIAQPSDGILYDLNRSPEVVMTFISDPKWVNDFAVGLVIKRLKEKLDAVGLAITALCEDEFRVDNWRDLLKKKRNNDDPSSVHS